MRSFLVKYLIRTLDPPRVPHNWGHAGPTSIDKMSSSLLRMEAFPTYAVDQYRLEISAAESN